MRTEVIAVMFTDLVEYTRKTSNQSHAQNAAMLRRLSEVVHPLVRSFGGRVVKDIGDGMLSVFDAPTSAVDAAMAIQDRLAEIDGGRPDSERLHLRVAINVGEVRKERGDVFGDAVNIAARIESHTPADAIYLSESTYLTMNKAGLALHKVGPLQLKGLEAPVTVYSIPAAPRVAESGTRPSTLPYLGRKLAELRRQQRRRRIRQGLAMAGVAAAAALVAHVGGAEVHRALATRQLEQAVAEENYAVAAEAVMSLQSMGAKLDAALDLISNHLDTVRDPAAGCLAAARLEPVLTPRVRETFHRHRLRHALQLVHKREVAQASGCLSDLDADPNRPLGRELTLLRIHLDALMAVGNRREDDLKRALEAYEAFLRRGRAPQPHVVFIAQMAAEGFQHRTTRAISDSLVAEYLGAAAAPALVARALDGETHASARAWIIARLESIENAPVDWTQLYATVLAPNAQSTCAMRRAAVEGLRRGNRLSSVGWLAREAARGDHCTKTLATEAIGELVSSGRSDPISLDAAGNAVIVAAR